MPGTAAGGEVEAARELIEQAVDSTSGDAHATVIIGDATYEFRPLEPGPDDDFYSFCTTVAGSLQGTMQLVDGTGAHVADGEISFVFLEPGGAYASTGDPPELLFTLPADGQPVARSYVADEITDPRIGSERDRHVHGRDLFGDDEISGTINASC